jgi:ABC-2 type transport system permease protein
VRKVLVIAAREYNAAVRTKAFIVSLLLMPVMMSGSILVQALLQDRPKTEEKHYAVIDRTQDGALLPAIREALQKRPLILVETAAPEGGSPEALDRLHEQLSDRVRQGNLVGYLEIKPGVYDMQAGHGRDTAPAADKQQPSLVYRTNRPLDRDFAAVAEEVVTKKVRERRGSKMNLNPDQVKALVEPVQLDTRSLLRRAAGTGAPVEAPKQSPAAAFLAPFGFMMLMFMVVMMTATPLLQAVLEEKMQRIAEVLLGSVRPFPLMLGKLLGMTGVSLTVSAVYLGGAWWAANRYGYAEYFPPHLLAWFVVFQVLAVLMFGSLFIAIGAACTEAKETQSLLMPVMLLVCVPFFVMGAVIQEPNGSLVTGLSFFPFSTPMLMMARMAVPPGIPSWQPAVGVAGVLLTTLVCVWAAGRIFRVGILMQGKGARLGDLARWVLQG